MADIDIRKKEYVRPEIEVIVLNYKDVVAASGESFSVGVGDADTEIGADSDAGSFSMSTILDKAMWSDDVSGGNADGEPEAVNQ